MHGFFIEHRELSRGVNLSQDLAQQLYIRSAQGCVVVVADRPHDLAAITKKQWNILIRHVQRERSSTLKAARIAELSNQIGWMQNLRFVIGQPKDLKGNTVVFTSTEELTEAAPVCGVLYITNELSDKELKLITIALLDNAVIIMYGSN